MNLNETIQLLNNLEIDYKVYTRKAEDDIILLVNHKDDTSTVMFYDKDCNYIKTL